jgi:ribonuclease HII
MKSQIKKIAGVDEVGRGAWAGPLVAAAVILNEEFDLELKDSKKLNFAQRQWLAQEIKQSSYWAVGLSSQYEIDKLGLQRANILAAQRAIDNLPTRPQKVKLDFISGFVHRLKYKLIVRGDSQERCIMAAAIVAKDYRDGMMIEFNKHYKNYAFHIHKGYGTKLHQQKLLEYGPCVLHRTSYLPIKKYALDFKKRHFLL